MNGELWRSICELYMLLQKGETASENEFQRFFETNGIVFKVLGFDDAASYEKSSGNRLPYDVEQERQHEPDFICIDHAKRTAIVFELKTPKAALTTSRGDGPRIKFRAEIESYISQTSEYIEFIKSNHNARKALSKKFNVERIDQVKGVLVCGLGIPVEIAEASKLISQRSPRIELLHFDEIFDKLVKSYSIGRPDIFIDQPDINANISSCIEIVAHVILNPRQTNARAFIFDFGDLERNRVSLYLEDDLMIFRVLDHSGKPILTECRPPTGVLIHIRMLILSRSNFGFASLFINNEEVAFRLGNNEVDFHPDLKNFVIGASLSHVEGARFSILTYCIWSQPMVLRHRIEIYFYLFLLRELGRDGPCVEFNGSQYLFRCSKSDPLAQADPSKQPAYHATRPQFSS